MDVYTENELSMSRMGYFFQGGQQMWYNGHINKNILYGKEVER